MSGEKEGYFIGVDVGTSSARAGLFDTNGNLISISTHPIKKWSPLPDYYEQSSVDIWSSVCHTVKEVVKQVDKSKVKGIGFDATCSLVAVKKNGEPVSVSPHGGESNIIMWMDHRAGSQAEFINSTGHYLLNQVGGKISLEMEIPKLMWIQQYNKKCWKETDYFFDLPDFLTWRATDNPSRSLCSLVCKWLYEAGSSVTKGWNKDLFKELGIDDLLKNSAEKIGSEVRCPGDIIEGGLSVVAANELGLLPGTSVATSMIDAHAGGLGLLACSAPKFNSPITHRLALICGTSTCFMGVREEASFIPGVWGPYYSAMVPSLWLNEGGQSATGELIDYITLSHPAAQKIEQKLQPDQRLTQYLNTVLLQMATEARTPIDTLTTDLHVWPDFHGNRSPLADPSLKGMVCGLNLSSSEKDLALLYLATLQSLAYGSRHIMEAMEKGGYTFETLLMCGGLSKNPLFVETLANALGKPVLIPNQVESVLLGSAILGATAAKAFPSIKDAMSAMSGGAQAVSPSLSIGRYHEKKYKVFLSMLEDQKKYRDIMK